MAFQKQAKAQLLDSLSLDTMHACTSIAEAMKHPDEVRKLVLRRKHLEAFPKEIFLMHNLQYLDLSKNKITVIPSDIKELKQLQVLQLARNNIDTLPPEIGDLKNLFWLNVNQNGLYALPAEIGKLTNLRILDLWNNNLSFFPDQMKELRRLKMLDLRVIIVSDINQKRLKKMLPHTLIYFSPNCRCEEDF
ncbi:MAG: leucine-rich repeat domain-containing protein [Bacteroidia bacterium]